MEGCQKKMKNYGNQENIVLPGIRINVNLVLVCKVVNLLQLSSEVKLNNNKH